eukprot:204193-Pelagomonas_calceolata.AAC.6
MFASTHDLQHVSTTESPEADSKRRRTSPVRLESAEASMDAEPFEAEVRVKWQMCRRKVKVTRVALMKVGGSRAKGCAGVPVGCASGRVSGEVACALAQRSWTGSNQSAQCVLECFGREASVIAFVGALQQIATADTHRNGPAEAAQTALYQKHPKHALLPPPVRGHILCTCSQDPKIAVKMASLSLEDSKQHVDAARVEQAAAALWDEGQHDQAEATLREALSSMGTSPQKVGVSPGLLFFEDCHCPNRGSNICRLVTCSPPSVSSL